MKTNKKKWKLEYLESLPQYSILKKIFRFIAKDTGFDPELNK